MSSDVDTQEILKRLKALEEENAKLRQATINNAVKPLIVTESEYKGHPTLVFEGPCKPFTLGLKKLSILKQAWPQVELFLERHLENTVSNNLQASDEVKI